MRELSQKELKNISGGALGWKFFAAVPLAISLIAGIVDGYLRPLKCN